MNPITFERYSDKYFDSLKRFYKDEQYSEFFRRIPKTWKDEELNNFEGLTGAMLFAINLNDVIIGFATIDRIDWINLTTQAGIGLFKEFQDKEVESSKLCLWCMKMIAKLLLEEMPLRKISFMILKDREDLEKSLIRGGLVKEAELKRNCLHKGKFVDEVIYALHKETYDELY